MRDLDLVESGISKLCAQMHSCQQTRSLSELLSKVPNWTSVQDLVEVHDSQLKSFEAKFCKVMQPVVQMDCEGRMLSRWQSQPVTSSKCALDM